MRKKIIHAALLCLMISQVAGCSENSSGDIKVETTAAREITNTIEVTTPVTEVVEVEDIEMEEITETTETIDTTETIETTETPSVTTQVTESTENMESVTTQVTESTENMENEEIIEESFYYTEITDEIKDRIVGKSYPSDVKNAKIGNYRNAISNNSGNGKHRKYGISNNSGNGKYRKHGISNNSGNGKHRKYGK